MDGDASLGVGLLLEGIVVEELDEAAEQPKPAVESQPLRPRQRHPPKHAEDTPFGLFVAENVQLVSRQKHERHLLFIQLFRNSLKTTLFNPGLVSAGLEICDERTSYACRFSQNCPMWRSEIFSSYHEGNYS